MPSNKSDQLFESARDSALEQMWNFYPNLASALGLHEYDGSLTDLSGPAVRERVRDLQISVEDLKGIDLLALSRANYFDHKVLLSGLQKELFELKDLEIHRRHPMDVIWHIELSNYIHRDYAPLEQRVASLTSALEDVPVFVRTLRSGLIHQLNDHVIETSIEAYDGIAKFYEQDIVAAVSDVGDDRIRKACLEACATAAKSVQNFVSFLEQLRRYSMDRFSIGSRHYSQLLNLGEMVDIPLEQVLDAGELDLEENLTRLREAAKQIDPNATPTELMARVSANHPTAEKLVPETSEMLEEIRQFVIDNDIVSVPSEVRCETIETPSFMRWATAAMDMPGPYETKATEAFYYVTPVEDDWTDEQKEQWLSGFNYPTLRNVSVHEAYPGHYVHYLHTVKASANLSKVFGAYSFWEGWAHYTEEMMLEEGFGADDPLSVLGQLSDALLRDCRLICSIKMHTQGMTVDEATKFFITNAFMEELPAQKEAVRGTFDPMYLNYTLGKLMIKKLREDYRAQQGDRFTLKGFHDTFLSFGAPPIPLVREMMLADSGAELI